MAAIGFTASRGISSAESEKMEKILADQFSRGRGLLVDTWVTGGCIDGDAVIGRTMARLRPNDLHIVALPSNRSRVDYWWQDSEFADIELEIHEMPEGSSYKDRNQHIVDISNGMLGFPLYTEDDSRSLRSGTWQTIRLARKNNLPLQVFVLRSTRSN